MNSIADLMAAVASRLAGDLHLRVIFRDPAYRGADGCFYKSADGKKIIELKPYLDADRSLWVLLHECAHARLHGGDLVNKDVSAKPSGSMAIGAHDVIPENESAADQLARKWLSWARDHANYEPGVSELEALLWALLKK